MILLTFISSNELNAAYAADGYARVKEHSIGVVLTTFANRLMTHDADC
jgi:pyruvate decarboxylase